MKYRLIAFLLLFPTCLYSAPSITGVNGTASHGQSITISGSGFGAKDSASPVAWDDLEDGVCDTTATVGSWTNVYETQISTSQQRHANSTYNGHLDFNGDQGAQPECGFAGGANAPKWYVQYWFFLADNFAFASSINDSLGNIKIFRMWDTGSNNNFAMAAHGRYDVAAVFEYINQTYNWQPVISGYDWVDEVLGHGEKTYSDNAYIGWREYENDISTGSWHLFQFEYASSDIDTENGVLNMWFNGTQIIGKETLTTRTSTYTDHMRPFIVGFYDSHPTTNNDGANDFYIDDVYIDNTWARVEIGDAPSYNSCTHREIQIPTSWATGEITSTVNQGSFSDGTAYLFVVDADGAVSDGYEITLGSSAGGSGWSASGTMSIH